MPIPWSYFIKRMSVDPRDFIEKHGCKNHAELCAVLNTDDILPPTESEVEGMFPPPKPPPRNPKRPPQQKESLGLKSSAKNKQTKESVRKRAASKKPVKKTAKKPVEKASE